MDTKISHFYAGGTVFRTLDGIRRIPKTPLRLVIFIYDTRQSFIDILNAMIEDLTDFRYVTAHEDAENILLKISLSTNGDADGTEAYLLVYKLDPYVILVTNAGRQKLRRIISFWNAFYPLLSRIFFRSDDIRKLLAHIERQHGLEILVKDYVLKRYYVNKKIDMAWENIGYEELFEMAAENLLWVDSIHVAIAKKTSLGNIRINRKGVIQYEGCTYSAVESLFVRSIRSKYLKFYDHFLTERSRSLENRQPHPVIFVTDEDAFRSPADTALFLKHVKQSLSNWGYSTLYEEGIYLFLLLHDYSSGSSYEILIASTSEIIVTPQMQVTSLSFNTLINFFLNHYDGRVEDA
jgi:hypothetical protein